MRGKGSSRFGWWAVAASLIIPLYADVTLHGRVVDENEAPVRGARVSVNSREAQTDPTGAFTLTFPEPGDFLVIYTDGVSEATNTRSELFEEFRLRQIVEEFAGENVT